LTDTVSLPKSACKRLTKGCVTAQLSRRCHADLEVDGPDSVEAGRKDPPGL